MKKIILILVFFAGFVFVSCNNKSSTKSSQEKVFTDSISFWLSKKKAPNIPAYVNNLQKALKAIEIEPNDSIKSKYSLDLSLAFYKLNDSINFRKANNMALLWARKLNDSLKIAGAHWDAGDFLNQQEAIDSSYYHYVQAHKIYVGLHDDYNAARMLSSMASNLETMKDYTTAEIYNVQAIELLKPLENRNKLKKLYICYNRLGIISNNLKEHDKALEYYSQALEYLQMTENPGTSLPKLNNNIGNVYLEQGQYKLALKQFSTVIKTDSLYFKDTKIYALALGNYAYSQFQLGDTTNVRDLFNKSIATKDSIGDLKSLSRSYYAMSEFLLAKKDTAAALTFANKAKASAKASDNNDRVLETLGLLTQIDPKNATSYFQEHKQLNDSLQITERRVRNKFERIRFETNETLAENDILSRRNQLLAAIAGILLLLAIATYIIIDQRRKNEKLRFQEEQQESNQRIFNMLLSEKSKIEEGKQLAQKRISEELHDAVQSRLQGVRMLLLGLNKRTTPEAIEERAVAIKELKHVQEEVRAISHELSHAAYQSISSFIATVQELLNGVEKNTGLQSNFIFDEQTKWDNLAAEIKINVFRIIQESVQNCVKYAEANLVVVSFDLTEDKMFNITIEDNGKGFLVKNSKKGIGMRNINSRIEKLGGKWEIQSKIGEGTKVILYIPTSNTEDLTSEVEMKIA